MPSITVSAVPVAIVAGLGAWGFLAYAYREERPSFREIVILLFATGLILRLTLLVATPAYQAPDEVSHYGYVVNLYETGSLPGAPVLEDKMTHQYDHPPLYYLLLVPVYAIADLVTDDVGLIVRALRLPSVALWAATFWLAVKIVTDGDLLDPEVRGSHFVPTVVLSLVALLPTYLVLSSAINNDNLLFLLGAGVLYLLTLELTTRRVVLAGVLIGAAMLTKETGAIYPILFSFFLLFRWLEGELELEEGVKDLATAGATATVIWIPWALRNVLEFGGVSNQLVYDHEWSSVMVYLERSLNYVIRSFWAAGGIYNQIHEPATVDRMKVIMALAIVGLVLVVVHDGGFREYLTDRGATFMKASAVAFLFNFTFVMWYGWIAAQAQGRYIYMLMIPIGIALAIGLDRALTRELRSPVVPAGFFLLHALIFASKTLTVY